MRQNPSSEIPFYSFKCYYQQQRQRNLHIQTEPGCFLELMLFRDSWLFAAASAPDWWRCSAGKNHPQKCSKIQVGREIWSFQPLLIVSFVVGFLLLLFFFNLSVVPLPVRPDLRSCQAWSCPPVQLQWGIRRKILENLRKKQLFLPMLNRSFLFKGEWKTNSRGMPVANYSTVYKDIVFCKYKSFNFSYFQMVMRSTLQVPAFLVYF